MVQVLAYAVVLNFSLKICDVNVEIGKWNCKKRKCTALKQYKLSVCWPGGCHFLLETNVTEKKVKGVKIFRPSSEELLPKLMSRFFAVGRNCQCVNPK